MKFVNEIISEKKFAPIANNASNNLLNLAAFFSENKINNWGKKYYVAFVRESNELEDFLDDHGARNNKTWLYFGEIVASIRNFSSTAYIISHILSRIKFYRLNHKKEAAFTKDALKRLDFLNQTILSLFLNLVNEALHLGLNVPSAHLNAKDFEENIVFKIIPQNLDFEETEDIQKNVSRVATEFMAAFNDSKHVMFEKKIPSKNINNNIIPDIINEETMRRLESNIHNAQSMYDTYIQKTPLEAEEDMLIRLRGHISITLHLLGIAKELSHFIERHEISVRTEATRNKITMIVQRKKVLNTIVNFALYYYTLFIKDGQIIIHNILDKTTVVESEVVNVPEGLGFHLRPSTLVAKVANHYGSRVTMVIKNKEFDASSVIDIMWAGGMIKKEGLIEVEFRGDKNAVRDLKILAKANYGEDPMGNSTPLPKELSYLRKD